VRAFFKLGQAPAEELGPHHLAGARMRHFTFAIEPDGLFLVVDTLEEGAVAVADPAEERSQAIVIVLRPAFARVVVTFGDADADAEKELRHRLDAHLRITDAAIEAGRGTGVIRPARGDEVADKLVEGHIGVDLVPDPLVIGIGAALPDETIIAAE